MLKNKNYMTQEECIQDYIQYFGLQRDQIKIWITDNKSFCIRKIGTIGHKSAMAYKYDEKQDKYYN